MTNRKAILMLAAAAVLAGLVVSGTLAQPKDPAGGPRAPMAAPEMDQQPHPPAERMGGPIEPEHLERIGMMLELVERMKVASFDPASAGLIAIGGLRDEFRRKPAEVIKDLEAQLAKTKTLGLRNALRVSLKDLYKQQGEVEEALEHLRAMLAENDEALQARPPGAPRGPRATDAPAPARPAGPRDIGARSVE